MYVTCMYTRAMRGIVGVDARKINRRTHAALRTMHSASTPHSGFVILLLWLCGMNTSLQGYWLTSVLQVFESR